MSENPKPEEEQSQPDTNQSRVVLVSAKLKKAPDVPVRTKE